MKITKLDKILDQIQTVLVPKKDDSDVVDVPNVFSVDEPYKTHIQLGEQDEKPENEDLEDEKSKPIEKEPEEELPEELPEDNIEKALPGELPEEEPLEISEIGRIYELKKIYARLTSVESYLSLTSDTILLKLRNSVSQAISLFETLISNINTYKDDLDKIIIMFYKFLDMVYALLTQYYNNKKEEEEKNKKLKIKLKDKT